MSNNLRRLCKGIGGTQGVFISRYIAKTGGTSRKKLSTSSGGIIKSDIVDVPVVHQDICSTIFSRWEKWPEKDAFECASSGRKMNYAELLDRSLRWGAALNRIVPDATVSSPTVPRVTVFSPNVIEYAPITFGTLAAGWTLTTLNSNYKVGEVIHYLKTVKPKVLVVCSSLENVADDALRALNMSIPVLTIGSSNSGKTNVQEIIEDPKNKKIEPKAVDPSSPAIILQSGGTTGLPKGAVISHSAFVNNILSASDPRIYAYGHEDYPFETVTAFLPFYHAYAMLVLIFINSFLGCKVLVYRGFDPLQYGNTIEKNKVKFLHLVPTLLNFITSSGLVTPKHLASVKGVIIAAAPVLPAAANIFREMTFPEVIFQEGYGMTEVLGTHLTPKNCVRIGSCGKLIPNAEAKIIDLETGELLGPNQTGEIYLKCPFMMTSYLDDPKATAETIDEEGWLRSGDVAKYSEDGYFTIVDRIKDLLKVKALQVSPAEIEDSLIEHEAVAEAAVVGVPDERVGELPRAYVSLKSKVTEEELVKYIENRLSPHKWLTGGVRVLKDIPKNQAGKILRKDLKELVRQEMHK